MRSTGEKKWMPMKCGGSLKSPASEVIGSVEVLEPKTMFVADHGLGFGDRVGLDLAVLEHRLDHQVAVLQRAVIGGRRDARQQRVALRRLVAALVDLVGQALLQNGLALVGALLVAVDQHHVEARLRADIGDAGAHEAGADDADFLQVDRRHVRRAAARPC